MSMSDVHQTSRLTWTCWLLQKLGAITQIDNALFDEMMNDLFAEVPVMECLLPESVWYFEWQNVFCFTISITNWGACHLLTTAFVMEQSVGRHWEEGLIVTVCDLCTLFDWISIDYRVSMYSIIILCLYTRCEIFVTINVGNESEPWTQSDWHGKRCRFQIIDKFSVWPRKIHCVCIHPFLFVVCCVRDDQFMHYLLDTHHA